MNHRHRVLASASAGMLMAAASGAAAQGAAPAVPVPTLDYAACPAAPKGSASTKGFLCATAVVPIDYADPAGAKFALAVIKRPAEVPSQRIGTVFWNPGGPSDAGTQYLPAAIGGFPEAVRRRFDIVSWDPRGMGGGTRPVVQCFDDAAKEARFQARFESGPSIPVTTAQLRRFITARAAFNRQCVRENGDLLAHVSTADNARDLDLLRQAVGEEKITYYGTSYGTFLGATYINMFPDRVRAAVLDGAVNPPAWAGTDGSASTLTTFLRIRSDIGARDTVAEFMRQCGSVSARRCAFSAGSPAATLRKYSRLLARTKATPVTLGGETIDDLGIRTFVQGSIYLTRPLPGFGRFPGWPAVAESLQQIQEASERPAPAARTSSETVRSAKAIESAKAVYLTSAGRQLSVVCGESPNPTTIAANIRQAKVSYARAGVSAWPFVGLCQGWTARAAAPYLGPWTNARIPVLVIGNRFDPATPYSSSKAMAASLFDGRFLEVRGFGHTVLLNPSTCAQTAIADYVISGVTPPPGTVCRQDAGPFGA